MRVPVRNLLTAALGLAAGIVLRTAWPSLAANGRPDEFTYFGAAPPESVPSPRGESTTPGPAPENPNLTARLFDFLAGNPDSAGCAQFADTFAQDGERDLLYLVLRTWAVTDPPATLQWIIAQRPERDSGFYNAAIKDAVVTAPEASLDVVQKHGSDHFSGMAGWALRDIDPAVAVRLLDKLSNAALRGFIFWDLLREDSKTREEVNARLLRLADADMSALVRMLGTYGGSLKIDHWKMQQGRSVNALAQSRADAFIAALPRLPATAMSVQLRNSAVYSLATTHPADALRLLADLPENFRRHSAIRQVRKFADTHPDMARQFADIGGPEAMRALEWHAAGRDGDATRLFELIESMSRDEFQESVSQQPVPVQVLAAADAARAARLEWDRTGREEFLGAWLDRDRPAATAFLSEMAGRSPADAQRAMFAMLGRGIDREAIASAEPSGLLRAALAIISRESIARTADGRYLPSASFLALLDNHERQLLPDHVYADTARGYVSTDPDAGSAWVNTLAPGTGRDAAIGGIIKVLLDPIALADGTADFATALTWAVSVNGPERRVELTTDIARQWLDSDPANTVQFIQDSTLDDSERAALFNELGITP